MKKKETFRHFDVPQCTFKAPVTHHNKLHALLNDNFNFFENLKYFFNTIILYSLPINVKTWRNALIYFPLVTGLAQKPCVPKDFNKGGTVCVCNATYCDTIAPADRAPAGKYLIYSSSIDGHRMEKSIGNFSNSSLPNGDYLFPSSGKWNALPHTHSLWWKL